jgi:predicted transcriptional regulator
MERKLQGIGMATKKKAPRKKKTKAKASVNRSQNRGFHIAVSQDLEARLEDLAKSMRKSMDEILIQAVSEFADTWEDHQRVVETLADEDDRLQIVVEKD